jgi:poly(A) polymerase
VHRLRTEGLHHGVLPLLDVILEQPHGERFIEVALGRTDERVRAGRSVAPGFLFAALLWQRVSDRWQANRAAGEHSTPALMQAMDSVLDEQAEKLAIQRRFIADMREIWGLQPRLEKTGRGAIRAVEHLRFRAGYDFMLLRVEAGELPKELGQWWTAFVEGDAAERERLMSARPDEQRAGPRRRRRRSGRRASPDGTPADGASSDIAPDASDPPAPRVAAAPADPPAASPRGPDRPPAAAGGGG